MQASSCPDFYRNSMGDLAAEQASCLAECSHSLAQCCALNYMTPAFAMFCLSNFILYFWYDVPYVYTIGYAEKNLNIPNTESTMILSVIGILNTVGEVGVGWLADLPGVSSNALYAVCMLVCGLVTALTPFIQSYPVVLLLSALYGLCISANYSLTSPILVDLVSLDQFSSAYGCLLFCQGLGNLVGPPVAGWLYDTTREWFLTFCLAGIFIALSGALLMLLGAVQGARRCCQAREGEGEERGVTAAIV
jgi:MFS family permease